MRYEDWDVLLFPKDSTVPLKEFKTNCHVVHDEEFAYCHGSFGLPTMTCFMPGLEAGASFTISLHNWNVDPEISQLTRSSYGNHLNLLRFEARVMIDGDVVGSSTFRRDVHWPQMISKSFEFTKNGELQELRFPPFREELLRQSYWSPADDVGRIKIIISEAFPRDSLTVPTERVKNIVSFSFQHAPIEILETSGIAWPNPSMWQRGPFTPSMPVPSKPGPKDVHLHSPRRRGEHENITSLSTGYPRTVFPGMTAIQPSSFLGAMPNTEAFLQRGMRPNTHQDSFNRPSSESLSYMDWTHNNYGPVGQIIEPKNTIHNPSTKRKGTRNTSKYSSTDTSMDDYSQGSTELHHVYFDPDSNMSSLKVPTNTPTTLPGQNFIDDFLSGSNSQTNSSNNLSSELATTLTNSLLNQPLPIPTTSSIPLPANEVKSRKETRFDDIDHFAGQQTPASLDGGLDHIDMRKVSQSIFTGLNPNLGKELSRETSGSSASVSNNSTSPNSFSGIFSQRSGSGSQLGEALSNANVFTQPNIDLSHVSTPTGGRQSQVGEVRTGSGRVGSGMGPGSDKGTKRTRHFTPASSKAIDDEDEPRRSSPRLRVGFGDQGLVG